MKWIFSRFSLSRILPSQAIKAIDSQDDKVHERGKGPKGSHALVPSLCYLLPFLLIIACTGCSNKYSNSSDETTFDDAKELSGEIITFSSYLYHEKGLELEDSMVCFSDGKITRIRLDYSTMEIVGLCRARQLLVDVVEGFTHLINTNSYVAQQLEDFPINEDVLEIYIKFDSFFNRYIDVEKTRLVSLNKGIADYVTADALNCDYQCWHRRTETYRQTKAFADFYKEGEYFYGPKKNMYGLPFHRKVESFFLDVGEQYTEYGAPYQDTRPETFDYLNNQQAPINNRYNQQAPLNNRHNQQAPLNNRYNQQRSFDNLSDQQSSFDNSQPGQ
ncbi:MAG: hypothetical protein WB791_06210 [Waddliaceae bacterium]